MSFMSTRKQLDVTDALLEQVQFVADSEVKADDIVVFEATALNTRPLVKPGSIFQGAVHTRSTLVEMADAVNTKGQSVPLHTLHQQNFELPVGRVFEATVEDLADGQSELRARFFIAKSEAKMIEKINLGILDETSVGITHKNLLCSKCGFDYRGEEATFEHIWDRTCENGHVLGEDGAHLILQGMDRWMELSLVSRGAAEKAKIHGRAKSLMPQEQQDRLAASGTNPEAVTLFTSATQGKDTPMSTKPEATPATPPTKPEAPVEFDAKAAHDELMVALAALAPAETPAEDPQIAELKASVEALTTKVEAMTVTPPGDPAAELKAGLKAGGTAEEAAAAELAAKQTPKRDLSAFKAPK